MRTNSDSTTQAFVSKVTADDPTYRERVAIPTMRAIDAMPARFRLCVHEFGYVDVYRAWKRGWTPQRIRESAAANGGRFVL